MSSRTFFLLICDKPTGHLNLGRFTANSIDNFSPHNYSKCHLEGEEVVSGAKVLEEIVEEEEGVEEEAGEEEEPEEEGQVDLDRTDDSMEPD